MSREYTNKLLDAIEEGLLNKDDVINACLKYMSEDEVKYMALKNEFINECQCGNNYIDDENYCNDCLCFKK